MTVLTKEKTPKEFMEKVLKGVGESKNNSAIVLLLKDGEHCVLFAKKAEGNQVILTDVSNKKMKTTVDVKEIEDVMGARIAAVASLSSKSDSLGVELKTLYPKAKDIPEYGMSMKTKNIVTLDTLSKYETVKAPKKTNANKLAPK